MPIERSGRWSRWVSMMISGKIAAWLPWCYYCCFYVYDFWGCRYPSLSPLRSRELDGYDRDGGQTEMYKARSLV